MKAGRELDALVAEKVMGMEPTEDPWIFRWRYPEPTRGMKIVYIDAPDPSRAWNLFQPSADIKAAWEIVEKLKSEGLRLILTPTADGYEAGFLWFKPEQEFTCWTAACDGQYCKSAPHAICLAALKAKGVEV